MAASHLFDGPVDEKGAHEFLERAGHHCLVAMVDGTPVGFVSGVEMQHPHKPPEMFLYELGVDASMRRRGVGSSLVSALRDHSRTIGMRGMWVLTDAQNTPANATYLRAGASDGGMSRVFEWTFDDGA